MAIDDLPITIGDYDGLEVRAIEIAVTEELVDSRVDKLLKKVSIQHPQKGPIKAWDTVRLSYCGRISKKEHFGLSCDECSLTVGSGKFIDGFEQKLIGHKVGDTFSFLLNFPDIHIREELEGRLVRFEIHVLEVLRTPEAEIDDEYVRRVSEFSSVDELREAVREQLQAENESEMIRFLKSSACAALADVCDMDIPESLLDEQVAISLSEVPGADAMSIENLKDEIRKNVVASRALMEIARLESIEVTEQDIQNEVRQLSLVTGSAASDIEEALSKDDFSVAMRNSILKEKALMRVIETARLVDKETINEL